MKKVLRVKFELIKPYGSTVRCQVIEQSHYGYDFGNAVASSSSKYAPVQVAGRSAMFIWGRVALWSLGKPSGYNYDPHPEFIGEMHFVVSTNKSEMGLAFTIPFYWFDEVKEAIEAYNNYDF